MENFEKSQESVNPDKKDQKVSPPKIELELLPPQEGEITNKSLSRELNRSRDKIKSVAEEYLNLNPNYSISRKGNTGIRHYYTKELADIIRNIIKTEDSDIPFASPDEISVGDLAHELGKSYQTIQDIADGYKKDNPEYFVIRRNERSNKGLHYEKKLADTIRKLVIESSEPKNEGEITNAELAKELGIGFEQLKKRADSYKNHDEYFVQRLDRAGNSRIHYTKELADILRERIKEEDIKIPEAGNSDVTNMFLSNELHQHFNKIKSMALEYKEDHPEYFSRKKDKMGKERIHYTEELANIIRERIKKSETSTADNGEITNNALAKELGESFDRIEKIADKYDKSDTNYYILRKDSMGRTAVHYTERLATIIRDEIYKENSEIPKASNDEINLSSLAKELNIQRQPIKLIVDEYKNSHPEYFVWRRDNKNRKCLYYTKEFADIIRNVIIKQTQVLPDGPEKWISTEKIAENTGLSKEQVDRITAKLRQKHPDKFGKFKNKDKE